MSRRIVIWSPNYAPEMIGIAPLVTDAAEWLVARGHDVSVVTAMPNYPERKIYAGYRRRAFLHERWGAVELDRSWLWVRPAEGMRQKMVYESSFAMLSAPSVVRKLGQVDVLVCVVPSLGAATLAALMRAVPKGRRRPRLVLWVQDLVLLAAHSVSDVGERQRSILRMFESIEMFAMRAADRVIVCSPGFEDYLLGRGVAAEKIVTVFNWVDTDEITPGTTGHGQHTNTVFLYAGNLGYTQGFETLIEAARLVGPDLRVELVGDGNAAAQVRRLSTSVPSIRVRSPVPRDSYPALLRSADIHVVLQRAISAGANFPSKIASYLASGRPIVASIAESTPAADVLRRSGAALLVPPEDPLRLSEAMLRLHDDPGLRAELGRHAREFALRTFERSATLLELELALLEEARVEAARVATG